MFGAANFAQSATYREAHFEPCAYDRPLVVQFCANDPATLVAAAKYVAPHCELVEINIGCPQNIARRGRYGAYLMDNIPLICEMIRTAKAELPVHISAKIRCFNNPAHTVAYAKAVVDAGATILTVHGRTRDMRGVEPGVADWSQIANVVRAVGARVPVIANGNIFTPADARACLAATGADAVMSAEALLWEPRIFHPPSRYLVSGRQAHMHGPRALEGITVAARYLQLCGEWGKEINLSIVRGHLLKILFHAMAAAGRTVAVAVAVAAGSASAVAAGGAAGPPDAASSRPFAYAVPPYGHRDHADPAVAPAATGSEAAVAAADDCCAWGHPSDPCVITQGFVSTFTDCDGVCADPAVAAAVATATAAGATAAAVCPLAGWGGAASHVPLRTGTDPIAKTTASRGSVMSPGEEWARCQRGEAAAGAAPCNCFIDCATTLRDVRAIVAFADATAHPAGALLRADDATTTASSSHPTATANLVDVPTSVPPLWPAVVDIFARRTAAPAASAAPHGPSEGVEFAAFAVEKVIRAYADAARLLGALRPTPPPAFTPHKVAAAAAAAAAAPGSPPYHAPAPVAPPVPPAFAGTVVGPPAYPYVPVDEMVALSIAGPRRAADEVATRVATVFSCGRSNPPPSPDAGGNNEDVAADAGGSQAHAEGAATNGSGRGGRPTALDMAVAATLLSAQPMQQLLASAPLHLMNVCVEAIRILATADPLGGHDGVVNVNGGPTLPIVPYGPFVGKCGPVGKKGDDKSNTVKAAPVEDVPPPDFGFDLGL